jgi:hypothetical protein
MAPKTNLKIDRRSLIDRIPIPDFSGAAPGGSLRS